MMAKQAIANFSDMLLIPLSRFEMETIPTQIGRPCVGSSLTCSRRGAAIHGNAGGMLSAKRWLNDLGRLALISRGAFGRLWGMVLPSIPYTKALLMRAAAQL